MRQHSKPYISLKWFGTPCGTFYEYSVRLVNNKDLYYTITSQTNFESANLYDAPNFEESFEIFCELALVLKGLCFAETLASTKNFIKINAEKLLPPKMDISTKLRPMFLGDSELAVC